MARLKRVQAKHITDKEATAGLKYAMAKYDPPRKYACIWDVQAYMARWPSKVVRAKLQSMDKRGLISGCFCGCRGDIHFVEEPKMGERDHQLDLLKVRMAMGESQRDFWDGK